MDDRSSQSNPPRGLSEFPTEDAITYRPVSTVAVLGCLLAVVSILALVSPWFSWLPVVAIVLSYAGARSVSSHPDAKTGLGVALAGLAIASGVFSASFVRSSYASRLHTDSCRAVVEQFVGALAEGDVASAYELTLPYVSRRPDAESVARLYEQDVESAERLANFAERDAVELVLSGDPVYLSVTTPTKESRGSVSCQWFYEVLSPSGESIGAAVIECKRPATGGRFGSAAWRVTRIERAQSAG